MAKKIYIDAGHGGSNPGATYNGRKESEDVFKLATSVSELLKEQGFETKLSRVANSDPDLNDRAKEANNWGADYFISIHRNAFSPNKAKGAEVWVYSKVATNGETYSMAANILKHLCSVTGFDNRGVKLGAAGNYTDYAVNRETKMSSCLLEVGFVDNDSDNKIFDDKFIDMAKSIAIAICENCGVEFKAKTEQNSVETTSGVIYRVQVGAFSKRENAEAYAAKIKAAGFDAIIVTSRI